MMRQLSFIFIALISFLFVTSAVFLRRTIAVLLCGVLSFNSTICYSFLANYGKADAATPGSNAVVTSKDFSVVQKDEQKIADCFLGVCVNLPKSPIPIPGVTDVDPLGAAKAAIVKQLGEAVGVGSPLLLDQKTAYPDVSDQVKDFHPQKLTVSSAEDLQKPLSPGDYSLDVIAYCTQFSIHAPGQGLPYKLAPLMGKQAPAISALLSRGTLQGIAPATLNADSWRIQAGLPLKQWPSQDQALIHKLIPEYEKGLEGDYLQQIENTYNQYRLVPGIPSLNDLLRQSGAPGQLVLQLRQARQTLADQTISAERLPDMLYEPTGDGLPRVLPSAKDSSPSLWAEVQPGVFARFTVIEGNLGKNLFEFRVTPKAIAAINNSDTVATEALGKNLQVGQVTTNAPTLGKVMGTDGSTGLIGYSKRFAAQALILIASIFSSDAKADELPTLVITEPSQDWEGKYPITNEPAMPRITATAELRGIKSINFQAIQYKWSLQIGGYEINKKPLVAGLDTNATAIKVCDAKGKSCLYWYPYSFVVEETVNGSNSWTPDFNKSTPSIDGGIVGGWAKITVEATVNNETIKSDPRWIDIPGQNPNKELVFNYINSKDVSDTTEINDVGTFKKIFGHIICHESRFRQFDLDKNKKEPIDNRVHPKDATPLSERPLFGQPAGIGLAQKDPAVFPDQQWNWKANIDAGVNKFKQAWKSASTWANREQDRLNDEKKLALDFIKQKGFTLVNQIPEITVPKLNNAQIRRDAIRQYNGGHEYHFNANYIAQKIDPTLKTAAIELFSEQNDQRWIQVSDTDEKKQEGTVGGSWGDKSYKKDKKGNIVNINFDWGKLPANWDESNGSIVGYVDLVEACKGLPRNKLSILWGGQDAHPKSGTGKMPIPQEILGCFFIWKSLISDEHDQPSP